VRFREIDAYGHMNMVHYLTHFIDHRFEGMRRFLKLDLPELMALPIAFHTRHLEIDYVRPLQADAVFVVTSRLTELKNATCHVLCEMHDEGEQLVSTCRMRIGCIDKSTGKPCAWPAGLMERFYEA
jgi:YbgC/YbaW family acyl-CoA thioester hydrolase